MTIINTVYIHETNDTLYEYYVQADVKVYHEEGMYHHDAPSDWDYYGGTEVNIDDFKITKIERYVDGVMVDFCDDEKVVNGSLTHEVEQGILGVIEDEVLGG